MYVQVSAFFFILYTAQRLSFYQEFNSKGGGRLSPVRVSTADRRTVLGTPQTPNARLPPDVLGSTNTAIFGTTQISGCQGDFCSLDIRKVENRDIDLGSTMSKTSKLSEFRQNLMRGDEFDVGDKLPLSPGGSIATDTSNSQKTPFSIPYRTVIQTRQEMPFVKLALERHRRGEEGDYVSVEYYDDLATSGKLPSVFYKDVPCCENCYKVYNIIEEARAKALAKIVARKSSPSKKTRTVAGTAGTRGTTGSSSSFTAPAPTNAISLGTKKPADTVLHPRESESGADESLKTVVRLIDGLTKMDIAEIRTMTKPPAAVEIVLEAVMVLLTGKVMPYLEIRKLMGSGESFLLMLRDFRLSEVSEERLQLIEPYVDNPVFRPENVMPVSLCASKFCGWVIGVVQAARWQRGKSHKRIDLIAEPPSAASIKSKILDKPSLLDSNSVSSLLTSSTDNLTFVQKLERRKAKIRQQEPAKDITRSGEFAIVKKPVKPGNFEYELPRSMSPPKKVLTDRERTALAASQKRAANRLSSHNKSEGNMAAVGEPKTFRCADGITKMAYIALGGISLESTRSNFVVVHDFFDTCDATAIFFKPIVQRHNGCQVFCFNYPGQANTTWPRPPAAERQRGAPDLIFNNDWIADRMHELLQHAEENGDILLTNNFHLVGFGNGACIATAFLQKWGKSPLYSESLKSFVAINGFLYPDPQLSAILHSAAQVFESTPHNRPDIPVSYWARFIFSEEYLGKINPNLALNIFTAVSNPITNEGRMRISRGCLQHRDVRSALSPENLMKPSYPGDLAGYSVPVILVQSTENALVNASNVDNFLVGRKAKHLWSHQQNILSEQAISKALDPLSRWVGKMSSGPVDYQKYSVLGMMK
jgi:pimeloyl-ACP methyl ester carboxylesterase